jgi:hypothetical protein
MTQADRSGAFSELMAIRAMTAPKAAEVTITGADPFYQTPFRIGETVAAVLAATGVAANDLWELRTAAAKPSTSRCARRRRRCASSITP